MLFGLTIQTYGVILSLALATGWWLVSLKAKQLRLSLAEVETASLYAILGGIVGARVWHIVTDWSLYQSNLLDMIRIWQGGLSILGAVVGGFLGLWLWQRLGSKRQLNLPTLLDLSVFGLPFAQAVGRWGNYVNQELYGWPTTLPWGISIEPRFRVAGLEASSHFHPLFLYESLLMIAFGLFIWRFDLATKTSMFKLGSGNYFWLYLAYYALVRFLLDFMRPDKALLAETMFGVNQLVLVVVAVTAVGKIGLELARNRRNR